MEQGWRMERKREDGGDKRDRTFLPKQENCIVDGNKYLTGDNINIGALSLIAFPTVCSPVYLFISLSISLPAHSCNHFSFCFLICLTSQICTRPRSDSLSVGLCPPAHLFVFIHVFDLSNHLDDHSSIIYLPIC